VVGKSEVEARAQIQAAGLNASTVLGDPSPNPGVVTDQDPKDGKVAKGSTVKITVSQPESTNPNPSGSADPGASTPPDGTGGGDGTGDGLIDDLFS
jgi:beta-lactam-binding protein with PASTA domain